MAWKEALLRLVDKPLGKLAPHALVVLLASSVLLFLPQRAAEFLSLAAVVKSTRPVLGVLLVVSSSLLVTVGIVEGWSVSVAWLSRRRRLEILRERLHRLSSEEKKILRKYISEGTRARYLSLSDGSVAELTKVGVLWRASGVGELDSWAHNLQPWAWTYLSDHPELLR